MGWGWGFRDGMGNGMGWDGKRGKGGTVDNTDGERQGLSDGWRGGGGAERRRRGGEVALGRVVAFLFD